MCKKDNLGVRNFKISGHGANPTIKEKNTSTSLTGEFLISWRNSESAESACCRIS